MTRRRQLQGIALDLLGSFISRNNDVAGYWGIGCLCKLADSSQTAEVSLNLVAGTINPANAAFDKLLAGYAMRLKRHLDSRHITHTRITRTTIHLKFDPVPPQDRTIPITTWGKLYSALVLIEDDMGKSYEAMAYGYCAPHDRARESRSGGEARY